MTTPPPLSPAAQAVLDAVVDGALPPFHLIARPMAAVAIRALVEQTLPEEPWPVSMMGPVYVAEAKQRRKLRAEQLAIAAELGGTTATTETTNDR